MKSFKDYLDKIGEIGYVSEVRHSILYVTGLPNVKPSEIVIFETGELGQVLSIDQKHCEVIVFSKNAIRVSTSVARTDETFTTLVGEKLLGQTIDPLGVDMWSKQPISESGLTRRPVDITPASITSREPINRPFETGVSLVDLINPLGMGQRELVIGDRKTGKTLFLLQCMLSQTRRGTICIYAAIGKWRLEIKKIEAFLKLNNFYDKSVMVCTSSSSAAGKIFLTPYVAMTIAEYFKDQGKDVLLILDDLTKHAQFYREITLLARRFPGRSSYPGDIFYIHSRLLERGGNFKKGSITVLPVVESVMGDLSGYIQTNIMSMTDGHLYFDSEYFNAGKRPAVNPFLSVTRVGHQAHSPLLRDISRQLSSFLVHLEELSQLMHFGVEISPEVKNALALGERINEFFRQSYERIIPLSVSVFMIGLLWQGKWKELTTSEMRADFDTVLEKYTQKTEFKTTIDTFLKNCNSFDDFLTKLHTIRV